MNTHKFRTEGQTPGSALPRFLVSHCCSSTAVHIYTAWRRTLTSPPLEAVKAAIFVSIYMLILRSHPVCTAVQTLPAQPSGSLLRCNLQAAQWASISPECVHPESRVTPGHGGREKADG